MTRAQPSFLPAVVVGVIGAETFLVQPGFLGALVEAGGFSPAEAGLIVSADMFGMALMTLLLPGLAQRLGWYRVLLASVVLAISGNLACLGLNGVPALFAARLVAGLGFGALVSLSFVALGQQAATERAYGIYISSCLAYGAAGLLLLPAIVRPLGADGLFAVFAAMPLLALPALRRLADASPAEDNVSTRRRLSLRMSAVLGLAAIFAYFLAQGAVWAYLDRIGVSSGLRFEDVGMALAVSSVGGIGGALIATWQGARLGQRIPIALGISGSILSLAALIGPQSLLGYALLAALFNAAWNYVHPYLLAAMAGRDEDGRLIIWTAGLQTLGLAAGPALGASVVGAGYLGLQLAACGLFAASLSLMLPAAQGAVSGPSTASS